MPEPRVLAWVSGGAASVIAAKLAIQLYGIDRVELVRCETENEDDDNHRFEKEASEWLGKGVVLLRSEHYQSVWDVWQKRRYMAGPKGAPCTMWMKVQPRLAYQRPDDVHVFGYTDDPRDRRRFEALRDTYFEMNVRAPLVEAGITKAAALALIQSAGISLPRSYDLGFPNANCLKTGCVKASSPGYWSLYRHHFPERYERMAKYSRQLGKRLVQLGGKRRFLDELPKDWPTLKALAPACDFLCQHAEQLMGGSRTEAPEKGLRRPVVPASPEGNNKLKDLLNIPGLCPLPEKSWEDSRAICIAIARRPSGREACHWCGLTVIAPHGTRSSKYADIPLDGKTITLDWDRQRFRCRNCGRVSTDQHAAFHPTRQMTWRLVEWIGEAAIINNFSTIADDTGLSERAVSEVFSEWADYQLNDLHFSTPRSLAVDEVVMLGRPRLILSNSETQTVIDMCDTNTVEALTAALSKIPDHACIRTVTISKDTAHHAAVKTVLPHARILRTAQPSIPDIEHLLQITHKSRGYVFKAIKLKVLLDRQARLYTESNDCFKTSANLAYGIRLAKVNADLSLAHRAYANTRILR